MHKQSRGVSLVIDRQFRSVGRIKRATGTDDAKLFKLLDGMLGTLYKAGRIDILQAIQRGKLTLLEVWSRYRLAELDRLPTVETMRPLTDELNAWVDHAETGTWNRQGRRYAVRALLRLAKKDATVQDLPDLLRAYAGVAKGPTMFNRARSCVQAFLRDTLGKSHPLYARVRDVRAKRVRTREGNPQSPEQLAALAERLSPEYAEIAWSMALTGMGPGELWGRWTAYETHIHIHGTKRKGRVRDIPFVRPIARPTRLYRAFRDTLEKATDGGVQPYDFRRTFAHAMEMAGIPRSRRRCYMGHSTESPLDLYERHQWEDFWVEDADKLRTYWGEKLPAAHLRLA